MKKLFRIAVIISSIFFFACTPEKKIYIPKGFVRINDSISVKYISKNGSKLSTKDKSVVFNKLITNEFDLPIPFLKDYPKQDTFGLKTGNNAFWKIINSQIHSNDSLIICLPAHSFLYSEGLIPIIKLATSEKIYLHIKVQQQISLANAVDTLNAQAKKRETKVNVINTEKIESNASIKNDPSNQQLIQTFGDEFEKEEFTLKYFLEYTKPEMIKHQIENGYYFKIVKKGSGEFAKRGDIVTISYEGRFLSGKKFDDSSFGPEPFEFELGKPDQILKGLEKAIYKMQKGSRAIIYFSSKYGYGAEGSASGIVGKYNSLTFAVHLKKINSKKNERN